MIRLLVGVAALLAVVSSAPTQSPVVLLNRESSNAPAEQPSSSQSVRGSRPVEPPAPVENIPVASAPVEAEQAEAVTDSQAAPTKPPVTNATEEVLAPESASGSSNETAPVAIADESVSEASTNATTVASVSANVTEAAAPADASSSAAGSVVTESSSAAPSETTVADASVAPLAAVPAVPAVAAAATIVEADSESVQAIAKESVPADAVEATTEAVLAGQSANASIASVAGTSVAPEEATTEAIAVTSEASIAAAANETAGNSTLAPEEVSEGGLNATALPDAETSVKGASSPGIVPSEAEAASAKSVDETTSAIEGTTTDAGSTTTEGAPFITEAATEEEANPLNGGVPAGAPILAPLPVDSANAGVPFNRANLAQAGASIASASDQAGEGAASAITAAPQEEAEVTEPPVVDSKIDVDGNGLLSLVETQAAAFAHHGLSTKAVVEVFEKADANGDDELDGAEFFVLRPLVIAKAEESAAQLLPLIDEDKSRTINLLEAQKAAFEHHDIGADDAERMFEKTDQNKDGELNAVELSKFRRRLRGMTIKAAQKELQAADTDGNGKLSVAEVQNHVFKQEGVALDAVVKMFPSADNDADGELDAPEYVNIRRLVRAKNVDNAKANIASVDKDGDQKLNLKETQDAIFEQHGINGTVIQEFFTDDDVDGDNLLDAIEFVSTRTTVRRMAIENAASSLPTFDSNGDGQIGETEALAASMEQYGIEPALSATIFASVDHDKNDQLDATELADFLSAIRVKSSQLVAEKLSNVDKNGDGSVSLEEAMKEALNTHKVASEAAEGLFEKVDHDGDKKLTPVELVAFRRQIGKLQLPPVEFAAETAKVDPAAEQAPKAAEAAEDSKASAATEGTTAAPASDAIALAKSASFNAAAPNSAPAAGAGSESSSAAPVVAPAQSGSPAQAKIDAATAIVDQAEENAEAVAGPPETPATADAAIAAITSAVPAEPAANAAAVPSGEVEAEVDPAATAAPSEPEASSAVPSSEGTTAESVPANVERIAAPEGVPAAPVAASEAASAAPVAAGNDAAAAAISEALSEAPLVADGAASTELAPAAAEQNATAIPSAPEEAAAPAESSAPSVPESIPQATQIQSNSSANDTAGGASLPIEPVDVRRADPNPRASFPVRSSNARNGGFGGGRPAEPLSEAQAATDEREGNERQPNAQENPQESAGVRAEGGADDGASVSEQSDVGSQNIGGLGTSLTAHARATVEGDSAAPVEGDSAVSSAGGNVGAPVEQSGGFGAIEIATDPPKVIWPPGTRPIEP